jgi:hypothetical protein
MPFRGIDAVFPEIHTRHMNAIWAKNEEFSNVILGGT